MAKGPCPQPRQQQLAAAAKAAENRRLQGGGESPAPRPLNAIPPGQPWHAGRPGGSRLADQVDE